MCAAHAALYRLWVDSYFCDGLSIDTNFFLAGPVTCFPSATMGLYTRLGLFFSVALHYMSSQLWLSIWLQRLGFMGRMHASFSLLSLWPWCYILVVFLPSWLLVNLLGFSHGIFLKHRGNNWELPIIKVVNLKKLLFSHLVFYLSFAFVSSSQHLRE